MPQKYFFIRIALLIPLALLLAWFWFKSGGPDIREAKLITAKGEKSIKYPFENLEQENGELYTITFKSRSTVDYEIEAYDSLLKIAYGYGYNYPTDVNGAKHIEIAGIDKNSHYFDSRVFVLNLQHNGANRAFDIKVDHKNFARTLQFASFFVVLFLLTIIWFRQKNDYSKYTRWIPVFLLFTLICIAFSEFCYNIYNELGGALNLYDSGIFFAMGRAIANGAKYYTDIMEIKPPGFYFFVAIVIKIFGNAKPMHVFQAIVLFFIAITPVFAYFKFAKEKNVWFCGIAILLGLLLALYTGERAGEVQIESFGACVGAIAVFFMASPKFEQRKRFYIPIIALAMLGSCGMKEPFFFAILASSLLLADNFKTWCLKFLLPFIIACVLGIIILLATDIFDGYLNYLKYMSTTHTNANGSPWKRMLQVWVLFANMDRYAYGLGMFFIVLLVALFINTEKKIRFMLQIICAIILTSLAIAAGGEYYSHHLIFALPFYFSLWFLFLQHNTESNQVKSWVNTVLIIFLAFAVFNLPSPDWKARLHNNLLTQLPAKLEALYLDAVMDKANVNQFMVIEGLAGNLAFAYTHHSIFGPSIIWDPRAWERIPGWLDDYIDQISKAQLISFKSIRGIPLEGREKILYILENEFTPEPWESVADIPRPEGVEMLILFRKR